MRPSTMCFVSGVAHLQLAVGLPDDKVRRGLRGLDTVQLVYQRGHIDAFDADQLHGCDLCSQHHLDETCCRQCVLLLHVHDKLRKAAHVRSGKHATYMTSMLLACYLRAKSIAAVIQQLMQAHAVDALTVKQSGSRVCGTRSGACMYYKATDTCTP